MRAYLAPYYDYDVFVSYSHGDPRRDGKSPLKDWTRALVRDRLERQILALLPEFDPLHIFMDDEIDPTAQLTGDLRGKVTASGVLLIVLSERYLGSSWCHDELEWFRKQIRDRASDPGRVFVIRAQKTEPSAWPDCLRDERGNPMIGFAFYDPQTGIPWGWPDLQDVHGEFQQELIRLLVALTKRLRELRQTLKQRSQAQATPQPAPAATGSRPVYLHSSPESDVLRADIESALSKEGITTIAEHREGQSLREMQFESQLRVEAAKRCDALALLRPEDNDRFVGDLFEIGVDERERIAIARGAPLPCALLDKTGQTLPVDVAPFGINRFDVNKDAWRGEFHKWLDAARVHPQGVPS